MGVRKQRIAGDRVILTVTRKEGGAVQIETADDIALDEMTPIMLALSELAQMRGWHPGQVARAYSDLQMRRQSPLSRILTPN